MSHSLFLLLLISLSAVFSNKYRSVQNSILLLLGHSEHDDVLQNQTYFMGWCPHGLSNRLRNLAGCLASADILYITNVVYAWSLPRETPNHFLDIFDPIPHVKFIAMDDFERYRSQAKVVSSEWDNGIVEVVSTSTRTHLEHDQVVAMQRKFYSKFVLRQELFVEVRDFVALHSPSSLVALHIRRSDFPTTTTNE